MRNIPRWISREIIDAAHRQAIRKPPKRRPSGSAPALVEPPRGPVPLQGGAEAPLEFDS